MFCKNCGKEIDEKAVICPNCGVGAESYFTQNKEKMNVFAIIGFSLSFFAALEDFICFIIGYKIALIGFILSFFVAIAGLICSIIGFRNAVQLGRDAKGLAIAGSIINSVSMVLAFIYTVMLSVNIFVMVKIV